MANSKKIPQDREKQSYQKFLRRFDEKSGISDRTICLSLKYHDANQGQTLSDWEQNRLLAKALERLKHVCNLTVSQATSQQIIKRYDKLEGKLPDGSAFRHPRHVPLDVIWCSMHIQGKECVIGYFEDNIFHVVFLDKEHQFWPSSKKGT